MKRFVGFHVLVVSAVMLLGSTRPAWAGGSCVNSGDCDDNNSCTTDTCVSNNCQHNPVPPSTPCGSSVNDTCTDPDTCNAVGQCQRNDAPNGTTCTLPNLCITGETCDFGFCRGTYTPGCCTGVTDCTDHDPCTTDACVGNVCTHSPAAPGTPCGSSVDDDCTAPDTCNAVGECQANDNSDGEDCGGPDCLSGVCGELTYRATMLPEGGNLGSEPRSGLINLDGTLFTTGQVIDAALIGHAAAWECDTVAADCALTALPEGGAGTSVANSVACDDVGCLAVGSKGSPSQPAAWFKSTGGWIAQSVPLPSGGFTGGTIRFVDETVEDTPPMAGSRPSRTANRGTIVTALTAVGETVDPQGLRRATLWHRSSAGVWSVSVLPALSPGRESGASDLVQCDASSPPALCDVNELQIAGFAEDGPGIAHPVVWRETSAFGGVFAVTALPLPAGCQGLDLNSWDGTNPVSLEYDDAGRTVSTTESTNEGTTKAAVWRTEDFVSWTSTVLPPLAGQQNGKTKKVRIEAGASGTARGPQPTQFLRVRGGSYPTGGDPLLDGTGTHWRLDVDTLALTSGPTDATPSVSWPAERTGRRTYEPILINKRIDKSTPRLADLDDLLPPLVGPVVVTPLVAGSPQPHGALAIAVAPAGIPAVSTWGLAVLSLLVLTAATMVLHRRARAVET